MFVVVLGPYLFGLPAVKVVKQMTIAYFAFVALMLFGLLTCALPCHCLVACPSPLYSRQAAWIEKPPLARRETYFVPMTVYPLMSINVIFCAVGVYLSLPAQAGEELFMA